MVSPPVLGSRLVTTCLFRTPHASSLKEVSSWKWVAKRQAHPVSRIRCSEMAQAKPKPSFVLVPLPSSSMTTREDFVAPFKIEAVSSISAIKVLTPLCWQSPAPTLAYTASLTEIVASSQGTKQPHCASSTATPTCLMYVDLPPMLGPVTTWNQDSPLTKSQSFGMKSSCVAPAPSPVPPRSWNSTRGCLHPLSEIRCVEEGSTSGLQ
mmetsp:Transcript_2297/g.7724  ORF Transcript_2297/g.7724 Transcript_2297/m.7724 type:complete len:208 (-) Transcript_2297:2079-2702(-)